MADHPVLLGVAGGSSALELAACQRGAGGSGRGDLLILGVPVAGAPWLCPQRTPGWCHPGSLAAAPRDVPGPAGLRQEVREERFRAPAGTCPQAALCSPCESPIQLRKANPILQADVTQVRSLCLSEKSVLRDARSPLWPSLRKPRRLQGLQPSPCACAGPHQPQPSSPGG